ncbi:MAG: TIGR00282 family metallophosphoesterase [bacterium]
MKVLFIGDIVGRKGRRILKEIIPRLKGERHIDLIIANGENSAGGFGITKKVADEIFACGVDIITGGNHIFAKKEIYEIMDSLPILRALNYPPSVPGRGFIFKPCKGENVCVVSLCGRVFMDSLDCPFRAIDGLLEEIKEKAKIIIVDIHAEATSEKVALGWFLDGRVSAVIGTHTHIPTADAKILPQGTAYITDVGMVGAENSVIGVKKELVLKKFLLLIPVRFEMAEDEGIFGGAYIDIDEKTGKALSIEQIQIQGL